MILNGPLIRRRRRALGLTQRRLAKELGVTSMVVAALEDGTNHHALSLAFLDRLAASLAAAPSDLLHLDPQPELEPADPGEPGIAPPPADGDRGDLPAQLGALLVGQSSLTPVEALADATESSLAEVTEALRHLEELLAPGGVALHRSRDSVALRPAITVDLTAMKRLARSHNARRGLSLREAKVLRRTMDHDIDEAKVSNPDRVALERLRTAGIVTEDRRPQITPEAAAGLCVRAGKGDRDHR